MSRLLRARRHAGRGPAALHVEDHRRQLGEIGKADEFLHQRDAGSGRRGEGAGAVPGGADHHADRGELVLGLDDGVALPAGFRIGAEAAAMLRERLGHRGRGRDRVPGADGRAAIDRAEAGRVVALEEDAVADRVRPAHLEADRVLEMRLGVVAAHVQRFVVRRDELVLALELLGDELLDLRDLDAEEEGEGADIDDVLEQLALARVGVALVARSRSAACRRR